MKEFQNLMELKDAPAEVFLEIRSIINNTLTELEKHKFSAKPIAMDAMSMPFEQLLGGNIFIVEELADLKEVQFYDTDYVSVLENAGSFDVAHTLPSEEWIFMSFVENDAGGAGYFIPADIAACVPNIKESIAISHDTDQKVVKTFRGPMSRIKRISPLSGIITSRLVPISPEMYSDLICGNTKIGEFINLTQDEIEFINSGISSEEYEIIVTPAE